MVAMGEPKFVSMNLANPTTMPVLQEEVLRARCRPVHERTPLPQARQRVWYRHIAHGPLSEAEVESVDLDNKQDWNVYRFVLDTSHSQHKPVEINGQRVMELVDDPWPDVILRTEFGRLVTRESRIEGSPGWLPYP